MTRDRLLSLSGDGTIPELPARYSDTRVDLVFADGRVRELVFSTSGRHTRVADELLTLVRTRDSKDVSLAGCWYHLRQDVLPPYVSLKFADPGSLPVVGLRPGMQFIFSLVDARLLEVIRVEADATEQVVRHVAIVAKT